MTQSDLEKRVKARYPASMFVSVYLRSNNEFFGLLADLSSTGFKLTSEAEITADTEYELAIRNPFSGHHGELNFFSVKAIWCGKNNDGVFDSGFNFLKHDQACEALFTRLKEDFESLSQSTSTL